MSDIDEYIKVLKNWEKQPLKKTIQDVLIRAQKLNTNQQQNSLAAMLDALGVFHKQANKADKQKVDQDWFKQIVKSKNHLKAVIQQVKKAQIKVPKLIKSNSQIDYPQQEIKGKDQRYKNIMKLLYKHFLINMDEQFTKQKPKIAQFLSKVIQILYEQFSITKQQNTNHTQTGKLMSRVQSIYKQLGKNSSTNAKIQMVQGVIQPELVAKLDPKGFISSHEEKLKKERLDAIARQNQTGFYDELKKNINKDANQECRFCHKLTAYCQGQKQIRAADQPMTRFMICNTCGKRWRQE